MALTTKQRQFVTEYLVDLNATQAAIRAGYSTRRAKDYAYQLMQRDDVKDEIEAAMAERSKRTEITKDMVLARYWMIATADPNELAVHRRVCCRHCFGRGHAYQWDDEAEFDEATARAMKTKGASLPTDDGGYGFDKTLRPHPKCPKCKGEGHGDVYWGDTRDASPAAKALYARTKKTKDGFEIVTHDQLAALGMVARHLGMLVDKGGDLDEELKRLEIEKRKAEIKKLTEGDGDALMPQRVEVVVKDARVRDADA
ncbi:terminase small subunit [Pseudomonas sp. DTU_2021_1001937_2_SI_NGA_ILE_001]|uniref:terminase small subunit n=1 Tax=Pseudomonas sp. DTU_2021_1001937_2_SI_NGA_ILE_001 TaxID=3077589 RepID=UPI0028FC14F9|nr:terminase small subunit [Pseudomonas sp. DTU_2021_1001937_2_SI_NGA_ILE_001]WNW10116.1 terminase small subunit [Pseudomonas sp. DTU_2021_1001937_2_SI_NGA_ILE_001]